MGGGGGASGESVKSYKFHKLNYALGLKNWFTVRIFSVLSLSLNQRYSVRCLCCFLPLRTECAPCRAHLFY